MKTIDLIVPVAADKPEYTDKLPYVFEQDGNGVPVCIKSILGLHPAQFRHIYFTVLRKHNERYSVGEILQGQFDALDLTNAEVIVLEEPTLDQAETVYRTIRQAGISGPVFIKDGDCYFSADIQPGNFVAVYPIEDLEMLSPRDKSYVAVDDKYYITNIIEKRVVGHFIGAGGYGLESAEQYCRYYGDLRGYGRLYLSHIIYSMLLDRISFRPLPVKEYKDWGTEGLYRMNVQ